MANTTTQVFILTHNRPLLVMEAIKSALNQTYPVEVIVSDNSTNDDTKKLIGEHFLGVSLKYVKRNNLINLDHFNTCVREADKEFSMFFHDDDVLTPTAIEKMVKVLEIMPDLVAVGSNATAINIKNESKGKLNKSLTRDVVYGNPGELVLNYLTGVGVVPFSSYLYRTGKIKNIQISKKEGGKYSDVSFLLKASQNGPIYWSAQELIKYRIHSSNDSVVFDIKNIFSLCRYIKKTKSVAPEVLDEYKARTTVIWLRHKLKNKTASKIGRYAERILLKNAFRYYSRHPLIFADTVIKHIKKRI